ncbi:MAG: hypothetical protein AB8B62_15895 [Roseobacter sp.]
MRRSAKLQQLAIALPDTLQQGASQKVHANLGAYAAIVFAGVSRTTEYWK